MKTLLWILLSVCILKVISFTSCLICNQNSKEIKEFFKRELSRKHNEHWIKKGYIGAGSEEYKVISRDSTTHYLRNYQDDKWPEFERTRFQDYARYLQTLDTFWQEELNIHLRNYPRMLRTTVAEERAKREIYLHFKNLRSPIPKFARMKLNGLVSAIDISSENMHVTLVPFAYESHISFDSCQCGSQIFLSKDNPFYYTGTLLNWQCMYQHPKSDEVQVYDLRQVE